MHKNGPLTVLVTGGAGYIGSHTVLELLKQGHTIVALDNGLNCTLHNGEDKPTSLLKVEELTGCSIYFENISTLDKAGLNRLFSKYKIDIVIHFAALKAVGESVEEPLKYFHNNVSGTITLLESMNEAGVKRIVFSSSATVYGTPQTLPVDEDHPTGHNITNPYGKSKFMCEEILKDLTISDQDWQVVLLRYFNPVGAHESGQIGEDPKGVPNNLLPYISQVAVGHHPFLRVFGGNYDTSDGTGVRDYIHVVDLAKGHTMALSWMLRTEHHGWKAFNLGTGKGISVLEMVKAFSQCCGKEIPYKIAERRKGDLASIVASCEAAKEELHWTATKTLTDMCEDTWRWQKSHPRGFKV